MKLTESRLRSIIREELGNLNEKTTFDQMIEDVKRELERMGYNVTMRPDTRDYGGSVLEFSGGTVVRVEASALMVDAVSEEEFQAVKKAAKNTRNYQVIREETSKIKKIVREELSRLTEAEGVYEDNIRSGDGLSLAHAIEDEFGRSHRNIDGIDIEPISKRYKNIIVYGEDMAQKIQQLADREGIRLDLEVNELDPTAQPYY